MSRQNWQNIVKLHNIILASIAYFLRKEKSKKPEIPPPPHILTNFYDRIIINFVQIIQICTINF